MDGHLAFVDSGKSVWPNAPEQERFTVARNRFKRARSCRNAYRSTWDRELDLTLILDEVVGDVLRD